MAEDDDSSSSSDSSRSASGVFESFGRSNDDMDVDTNDDNGSVDSFEFTGPYEPVDLDALGTIRALKDNDKSINALYVEDQMMESYDWVSEGGAVFSENKYLQSVEVRDLPSQGKT